jgi:hypothetical protein
LIFRRNARAHQIAFILVSLLILISELIKHISMGKVTLKVCYSEQNNVPHMHKCGVLYKQEYILNTITVCSKKKNTSPIQVKKKINGKIKIHVFWCVLNSSYGTISFQSLQPACYICDIL